MELKAGNIKQIYQGKVAKRYDMSMSHIFARYKKKALINSSINKGDCVLVFCCGTGLDFAPVYNRIGKEGKIIGIDFSTEMLRIAEKRIKNNNWKNIELINADVSGNKEILNEKADAGICTLGLSIIPNFKKAYNNLLFNVKDNGEIIIGDMQLATDWKNIFNPITLAMAKRYGGTKEGHKNSLELQSMMENDLINYKMETCFFGTYYNCTGRKNE